MRFALLFLFSFSALWGAPLSLNQAIEILKVQNLELKAARYDVQSAQSGYAMADAQHYGQLNFIQNISRSNDAGNVFGFKLSSREASFYDFGFDQAFNPTTGQLAPLDTQPKNLNYPDDHNFFQSKLRYELPLYTGEKISAYTAMAKGMEKIARLDQEAQLQTKLYETRKSYYDMALLEDSLSNLLIMHENISRLEEMTKEMINEGYAKKIDLLEVQSKKADLNRVITELQANKALLYHYLSFLLNQDVNAITVPTQKLSVPTIDVEETLNRNLDVQKAMTALQVRENMQVVQESRYLPTIGAMAELQTSDDTFLGDANEHKSYTVGVQLNWNLFAGGADGAAIEQARLETLKIKTQSELAKQGISLRLKEIQTNIKTADAKIKSLDFELILAKEIYENYEGRYKEQLAPMSDVIIKQSLWLEKVLHLLKAQNSRNQEIFALEKLAALGEEQ